MTGDAEELLRLADGSAGFSDAYKAGDVIDLGGGITWRLSASLARSMNRDRFRRRCPARVAELNQETPDGQ